MALQTKTRKPWVLPRHRVIVKLVMPVIRALVKIKYGLTVEPFQEQGDRAYLVLMNHQTAFDQFLVGLAFRGPVYYIASEDLFSNGFISKLLRYAVAPIPIKKQTTDVKAVMNCLQVAREGGTIALAPEGNRTYSGRTVHINPAITPLVKKLGLPLAIFRIEGGYGVHPRWSDVCRKGPMKAYVRKVIEPETYGDMTREALHSLILQELDVDETKVPGLYPHAESAQYLERAMYVCPFCGLSEFHSEGTRIRCKKCGREVEYGPDKRLTGVGFPFPYEYVAQWYEYQCDYVNQLDTLAMTADPVYQDRADVSLVHLYRNKELLQKDAPLQLYADRVALGQLVLPFEKIRVITVLGKNKLNIYAGDALYQVKGGKRFNGLKYMNLFYRHQNQKAGDTYGKFLGI